MPNQNNGLLIQPPCNFKCIRKRRNSNCGDCCDSREFPTESIYNRQLCPEVEPMREHFVLSERATVVNRIVTQCACDCIFYMETVALLQSEHRSVVSLVLFSCFMLFGIFHGFFKHVPLENAFMCQFQFCFENVSIVFIVNDSFA